MFGAPTSWFAISRRVAPCSKATAHCTAVASVMPQAPASSWRRNSAGVIVVLPCGANCAPWSSA